MDVNSIGIILICILGIIVIGKIFKVKILKLIFNSVFGGLLIIFINQIGTSFGLHIGLNIVTSVFIGLFGVPGAIVLLLIKLF